MPFFSFSQTKNENDSLKTSQINEVVVSANKIVEFKKNIAQQVSIITAKDLSKLNSATTADALQQLGTVALQKSQQGGGSPIIRGFEASRVLLTIDGVRMNNLIFRAGHLQNILSTDQNSIDKIEVLYGPSSTIYGSDALGGSINIFTKNPEFNYKGATARGRQRVGQELMANAGLNIGYKKIAVLSNLTLNHFHDLRMGKKINPALGRPFGLRNYSWRQDLSSNQMIYEQNNDPYIQLRSEYSQIDFLQKIFIKPNENQLHKVNFQYSNTSNVPRYDRLTEPTADGNSLKHKDWYYGPQRRRMLSYEFDQKIAKGNVAVTLSNQNLSESRHDWPSNGNFLRSRFEAVNVNAITAQISQNFAKYDLRYGVDGQWNSVKSTAKQTNQNNISEVKSLSTRYPDGGSKMNSIAAYMSETWHISEKLLVTDGLRLGMSSLEAKFNDKTFFPFPYATASQNHFVYSGNVGLSYFIKTDWQVKGMVATGFRVPNIDDLAKVFETTATAVIVPNPDLKPEKTINYELSINKIAGDLRWENVAYFTNFSNAIVVDKFLFDGKSQIDYNGRPTDVYAAQNKRKATIQGFSSVISYKISQNFATSGSINLSKGRILGENLSLDHIPPLYGRIALNHKFKESNQELFVVYNGWKRIKDYYPNGEDNEIYAPAEGMPSWWTLNYRYNYDFSNRANFQIGLDNILDLQYRTFGSGINAPGRNFFWTLKISI